MMHTLRLSVVLIVIATSIPLRGNAQEAEMEAAREQFDKAQALYSQARYLDAGDTFMSAYAAKPFPAFLFNAAVCHEKTRNYAKAVELFRRYLDADPRTADRSDVERRIAILEAEARASSPTEPSSMPSVESSAILALPEARTKGLIVIESKPPGATIFLDDKKDGLLGVTPWNGSIEGQHTLILESEGYKTERKNISPSPDKLSWLYFSLSQEYYLSWIEVRANIPGAAVFIDQLEGGAVGQAPFMGNIQPGKHRIVVAKEGYEQVVREIDIESGKALKLDVKLDVAQIGYVRIKGESSEGARVRLNGELVCDQAPCRFQAKQGSHALAIGKEGKKTFERKLSVGSMTETTVTVKLADVPSRSDAVWQFVFAATFIGGGVWVGLNAKGIADQLEVDETWVHRGSYGLYGIGGIAFATGVWYLVRDKGPPSVGQTETQNLAVAPTVGPDHAGVVAAWHW